MVKMLERWEERKVDRERKGRRVKKCIAFVSPICYYLFGIPSVHYLSSVCLIDICCLFPYLTFLSCFYSTCFLLCLVLLNCFICLLTYLPIYQSSSLALVRLHCLVFRSVPPRAALFCTILRIRRNCRFCSNPYCRGCGCGFCSSRVCFFLFSFIFDVSFLFLHACIFLEFVLRGYLDVQWLYFLPI